MLNDNSYFSEVQWSVIIGSLLGDATITKPKYGHSAWNKPQCTAHLDYLKWHEKLFEDKCTEIKSYDNSCKGTTYNRHIFRLRSHEIFTELRQKWYPDDKKIIPLDLKLNPLMIAIWFFDDGSNFLKKRCAKFATYCFSKEEVIFLGDQLLNYDIQYRLSKRNELIVKTESYRTLIDLVKPYMLWPCFKHKVAYRDSELKFTTDTEAKEMYRLYHEERFKLKEIALKFGCTVGTVSSLIRGNRKRHLGFEKPELLLNNTSGYTNIKYEEDRKKWKVYIVRSKKIFIKRFVDLDEAINYRDQIKCMLI